MNTCAIKMLIVALCLVAVAGCGTPQAKLTYTKIDASGGADGTGFPFVVPRTILKVDVATDKDSGNNNVTFSTVPTSANTKSPKETLPRFVATDSSSNGWSLTPTTVTSVTYASTLIVSSLGTQVSDNRSDAINSVVTIAAIAGAFASGKDDDCTKDVPGAKDAAGKPITFPLKSFVVDDDFPKQGKLTESPCWGYTVTKAAYQPNGRTSNAVETGLASTNSVGWFPIPACTVYDVKVFRCNDATCQAPQKDKPLYSATVSLSDGKSYQKIQLPVKGKISLHADYCEADVTTDSAGSSDWGLLKELASDVKSASSKK